MRATRLVVLTIGLMAVCGSIASANNQWSWQFANLDLKNADSSDPAVFGLGSQLWVDVIFTNPNHTNLRDAVFHGSTGNTSDWTNTYGTKTEYNFLNLTTDAGGIFDGNDKYTWTWGTWSAFTLTPGTSSAPITIGYFEWLPDSDAYYRIPKVEQVQFDFFDVDTVAGAETLVDEQTRTPYIANPEPSVGLLLLAGMVPVGLVWKRRKRS